MAILNSFKYFCISQKFNNFLILLQQYLLDKARPGDWRFHSSLVTDQHPLELARMCVWEKLLDHLEGDTPYRILVVCSFKFILL